MESRFCSNCGAAVKPGTAFCDQCGNALAQTASQQAAPPPPPPQPQPYYQPPPQYAPPPAYPPPMPRPGSSGSTMLFWAAWGLLAALSLVMLVSGFSALRLIGFAAVLAVPLLLRKSLFRKLVPSLFSWLGVFVVFILVVSLFPAGGGGSNNGGSSGTIKTGKSVTVASSTVAPSGGTVSVVKPGDPLDGLSIVVPSASYASTTSFEVSYAPVTSQSFGADFNPVTPLIQVENGGAYSDELMEVKVPVSVPPDSFAMGFIYDDATGKLEGMPLVAQDATSITLGTRHFSSFVVSMIKKSALDTTVNTGFQPGVDDWSFTNYGSYIAPGGHCAGQSMTAMWYYVTQPDGAQAHLYGRYDNNGQSPGTPALWQDDSLGYRFASVVQKEYEWNTQRQVFWQKLSALDDAVTRNLFVYSMLVTGEPQMTGIWSSAGGGHAMVVYGAAGGLLYIADPNYPGNIDRRIQFVDGAFKPYNSGANAAEIAAGNGKAYESIEYWAKSAIVDYPHIAARWGELKSGTVGNGVFPTYRLLYLDDGGQAKELNGPVATAYGKITLAVDFSGALETVYVFRDGVQLPYASSGEYSLKPGLNRLGIYVTKMLNGKDPYVDFRYIEVSYGSLTLQPAVLDGAPGQSLTFTAILGVPLPSGYKLEWWADGALKKSGTETSFSISFTTPGSHPVEVRMVDASGKTVLHDDGSAIISVTTTTKPLTSTTTSTTSPTTRPPTSTTLTTSVTTSATGDTYNYAAALAQWMSDEVARIAATAETTPTYTYTAKLEWVVTPYIKDGNVMGASRIVSTKTFTAGGSTTWVSSETFDAQNPGVFMTTAQLRAKYPQFAK